MKLTNKQINKIRELYKKGMSCRDIASKLELEITIIYYYKDEETTKKRIKQITESFRKKSNEEKQKIYKKRLPYLRKWQRNKYRTDGEFRLKKLEKSKDYYKKIKLNKIQKVKE